MSIENEKAIERATATLREVLKKLTQGVNKAEFEIEFHNRYASPGVSVPELVGLYRIAGRLEERDGTIRFKPSVMSMAK